MGNLQQWPCPLPVGVCVGHRLVPQPHPYILISKTSILIDLDQPKRGSSRSYRPDHVCSEALQVIRSQNTLMHDVE